MLLWNFSVWQNKINMLKFCVGLSLSMGMSQDYVAAVEEGATMVRIGSAFFE